MKARIATLRVIQSDDRYPVDVDPEPMEKSGQFGPWKIRVRFGPIDQDAKYVLALMERGRNHLLDFIFGNAPTPGTSQLEHLANRDELIDHDIANYQLEEEWRDRSRLYCTVHASREIEIPDEQVGPVSHFWHAKAFSSELAKQHEGDAEEAVGYAVSRLLIAAPYRHTGPIHPGSPRLYLESDDRNPTLLLSMGGSAKATVGRSSWQPTLDALDSIDLNQGSDTPMKDLRLLGAIGKLYLMAYNESDPYKRFIFSYSGLEAIANGLGERVREQVQSRLSESSGLGEATVNELIWPKDVRDTDPNRPVRFRFAAVAAALSPDTAETDVTTFAKVNKARNSIHARLMPSLSVPTNETFHLLDRYATLAINSLTEKPESTT